MLLDPDGDKGFEEFAVHVFSAERERIARELLGESGRTLFGRLCSHIAHDRTDDANGIHSTMRKKTGVLAREEGFDEIPRHFIALDDNAVLTRKPRVGIAIHVVNHGSLWNFLH